MLVIKREWNNRLGGWVERKVLKKGDVRKTWSATNKTWDYEIIGDEKWKPKTPKFISKKMLEQKKSTDWITDVITFDEITYYKNHLKKDFENYEDLNDFKRLISLKNYSYYVITELSFFHFYKEYPLKEVYFFEGKLSKLFEDKPNLDRLKYRKSIKIPDSLKKVSNNEYGLITYWVFKDAIVFKN